MIALLRSYGWAQSAALEVQPGAISVSPSYSGVEARVVLKAGADPLTRPSLIWLSNDGVQVEVHKPTSSSAAAGQAIVWKVSVCNLDHTRLPGSVLFQADFISHSATQHAFATLPLTSQSDSSQKPVEASIEGNFDSVSQQRPGSAFLVVTNNLDIPMQMTMGVDVPAQVFKQPQGVSFPLPPRSATYTKIVLETWDRTTPGTYTILVSLKAEWEWNGKKEQRQFALAKAATAGVFFESDLLKLLGVPSFLLLPGCLFLFSMQLLLTMGILGLKNDSNSKLSQLTVNSPGFWIVAVSFSAAFTWAYSVFMKNNNLLRYGAQDLRNVWLASVGVGIVAYLLGAWWTLKKRRERVPTANDEPVTLLRKMGKNKVAVPTSKVKFKLGSFELEGYVVERVEDGMQLQWVAPQIYVDWASGDEDLKAQDEFEKAINAELEWGIVADVLEKALKDKHATKVRWSTNAKTGIPQPYHLKSDSIVAYLEPDRIFAAA